jgi:hypothetical protein
MDKAIAPAPAFVGIDVAKHSLDVHLRPSGERFTIDHDERGVAALVERLAALAPALVVLEATGGMEVRPAAALAAGRPAGRGRQPAPGAGVRAAPQPVPRPSQGPPAARAHCAGDQPRPAGCLTARHPPAATRQSRFLIAHDMHPEPS